MDAVLAITSYKMPSLLSNPTNFVTVTCHKLWFERRSVSRVRFCAHDLGLPALPAVDGYRSLGRLCLSQEPADSRALGADIRTASFAVAPCAVHDF